MPNLLVTRDHRINTHARIRRSSTMVLVGAHLNGHADRVINRGESFVPGELGEIDGAVIGYEQVPGDFLGTPTLLRIVDMPSEYETGGPCVRQEESRAEEGR
jgi:hypothetical protein